MPVSVMSDTSSITTNTSRGSAKVGSAYRKRSSSASKVQRDKGMSKSREQYLQAMRAGYGMSMSGKSLGGTVGSNRGIKVTLKTTEDDKAFLSSSKYLQQQMLASPLINATNGEFAIGTTPRSQPNSARGLAPSSRVPEDMYDEIIELKRKLVAVSQENSQLKGRNRRLEEDNGRKEKQIEKLLDPGKSDDFRRTLGEKRSDTNSVLNSLRTKVLKLEINLRNKENELKKLQSDVKTTRVEEMKVCMEAFYQEITRLRLAVNTGQKTPLGVETTSNTPEKVDSKRVKILNTNIKRLSDENKRLEQNNKSLREDLAKAIEYEKKPEGDFEDMNREQLLRSIYDMQKKLGHYEKVIADNVSDDNEPAIPGKMKNEGSFAERYIALDKRENELLGEVEKLKKTISNVIEERNHLSEELKISRSQVRNDVDVTDSNAMHFNDDTAAAAMQRREEEREWQRKNRRLEKSQKREMQVRAEYESKSKDSAMQLKALMQGYLERRSLADHISETPAASARSLISTYHKPIDLNEIYESQERENNIDTYQSKKRQPPPAPDPNESDSSSSTFAPPTRQSRTLDLLNFGRSGKSKKPVFSDSENEDSDVPKRTSTSGFPKFR